jgi:hypothetical protein
MLLQSNSKLDPSLITPLITINSISLVLGGITVIMQLILKKQFFRTMSFYFCAVTTLLHLCLLIGPMIGFDNLMKYNSFSCALQGAILQFLVFSSVCWFFWIAVQLYIVVVLETSNHYTTGFIWAHIISWGCPLLIVVIDLAIPGMSFKELWCWVPDTIDGLWEWIFYVPTLLVLLAVACLWFISLIKVFQYSKKSSTKTFILQNIVGVFLIFISYTIQFVHRFFIFAHKNPPPGLVLAHVIALGSFGSICFFVFGATTQNLNAIKSRFFHRI